MMQQTSRDRWLASTDEALLADCEVDTYRASGPGGQKRNKTSSAVRLRHRPSGLMVIAEESRSQHENKAKALRRLRLAIAISIRIEPGENWKPPDVFQQYLTAGGRLEISLRNTAYPQVLAVVLDVVAACRGQVRDAAELLGLSTAQLTRFILRDGKALDAVNRCRASHGHRPITS